MNKNTVAQMTDEQIDELIAEWFDSNCFTGLFNEVRIRNYTRAALSSASPADKPVAQEPTDQITKMGEELKSEPFRLSPHMAYAIARKYAAPVSPSPQQSESAAQQAATPEGWKWMTHPHWGGGAPIPVRVFVEDGARLFMPFDTDGPDFEWDRRDPRWQEAAESSLQQKEAALPAPNNYHDAYRGARDDMQEWKKRALEAEESCRRLVQELNEQNGPTFMGEPVIIAAPAQKEEALAPMPEGWLYDWMHSSALGKPEAKDAQRPVISEIAAERQRQMSVEGWTEAHDDEHNDRSMAAAAGCYVSHYVGRAWVVGELDDGKARYQNEEAPFEWPDSWCTTWWKPKNPRRDLVRAAALLVAEIERLDRAAIDAAIAATQKEKP